MSPPRAAPAPAGSSGARRPQLFYLLYYAAIASLLPFLVVWYERLGFRGWQIGVLSALMPAMALLAGPLWSALADRLGRHRAVALAAMAGAAVSGALLPLGDGFAALLPLVGALALFVAPIAALTDSAVLAGLGGERERYGRQRLWGAVGFGVAAPVVGLLTERAGLGWSFAAFAALLLAALPVAAGLRWREVADRDGPPATASGLRPFLAPPWLALLGAAILGGTALSVCGTYLYLYLADRGAGGASVGIAVAVATASEIPTLFVATRLLRRWRPRTLLLVALAAFGLRSALYGAVDATWALVAVQLLHGPSYGLMLVAGVARADRLAPRGRRATAQALFGACVMGLGAGLGALGGGALYDLLGARGMFLTVGVATLVASAALGSWRVGGEATAAEV